MGSHHASAASTVWRLLTPVRLCCFPIGSPRCKTTSFKAMSSHFPHVNSPKRVWSFWNNWLWLSKSLKNDYFFINNNSSINNILFSVEQPESLKVNTKSWGSDAQIPMFSKLVGDSNVHDGWELSYLICPETLPACFPCHSFSWLLCSSPSGLLDQP